MRKLYTDKEYSDMAVKANQEGKKLIKVQEEIEVPYEVYEYEKKIIQVPIYNEDGEIIGYEDKEVDDYDKPIIDEKTGEHKHHTEYRKEWVERLELADGDKTSILKAKLDEIDKKTIRSLRAIISGTAAEADREYLAGLEEQAENIRKELKQ